MKLPVKNPEPDVNWLIRVITGRIVPKRPPFVELFLDQEILAEISKEYMGKDWVFLSEDRESRKAFWKNSIDVYYRLGYDYIRVSGNLDFPGKYRMTDDTAVLSKDKRGWAEEGVGPIASWEDFERYQWPSLDKIDLRDYEYASKMVPEGMGVFVCPASGFLEIPMDILLGYENLSFLLYDDPKLVNAVFEKVGLLIYGFYEKLIGLPNMVGFFQGDDMGFKTQTLLAPDMLRKYVLPWHKKLAKLAHDNNLVYMLHSCGQLDSIMDDLIDDVKIDAKHSFEDEAMPVREFKKKYGQKVGVLGGVDIDKLCRLEEPELRKYIRGILDTCMVGGRYALGSGNSVCNYIPVENYMIMLEEGMNWGRRI